MKAIYTFAMTAGLAMSQENVTIFDTQTVRPLTGANTTFTVSYSKTGDRTVKGAPYTADSVTETVQVLADGNRISRGNKSNFARDTEGRTRRESVIQGLGPVGQTETPFTSVFIDDPIAKVSYVLDAKAKVAFKSKTDPLTDKLMAEKALAGQKTLRIDQELTTVRGATTIGTFGGGPGLAEIKRDVEVQTLSLASRSTGGKFKTEDLGTATMEGVSAKGTRTTMTIPAGEVGNERAIEVVTENWYSEEIKANVLTKHSDPRSGETSTKLMNVKLGNPSRTLFEPPADFKIDEDHQMRMATPAFRVREDR